MTTLQEQIEEIFKFQTHAGHEVVVDALIDLISSECERARGEAFSKISATPAFEALKDQRQADEDGIMVLVSRQALDEIIASLTHTKL